MATTQAAASFAYPVWVTLFDQEKKTPYFYNVQTQEVTWQDPDPEGHKRCISSGVLGDEAEPEGRLVPIWKTRPAHVQVEFDPVKKTAYVEGHDEFNVWYGKFENDRGRNMKEPASYRCFSDMDAGRTQADLNAKKTSFCLFFAKGCCSFGPRCEYHHHVPVFPDGIDDIAHDIFGRGRYAQHRDDMGGVGCFNKEGRTLFIANLVFDREQKTKAVQLVDDQIREGFGEWGEIEEVRVISSKAIAFVRFALRASAEFAKVAMADQKLGLAPMITVKWAHDDPARRGKKRLRAEMLDQVDAMLDERIKAMNLTHIELATLQLNACRMKSFTAPYPDTSSLYPKKEANPADPSNTLQQEDAEANEQSSVEKHCDVLSRALARIEDMKASFAHEAASLGA